MKAQEGFVDVPGGKVWFTRIGEQGLTPLLVLHGGPGNSHQLLKESLKDLADERQVIFYDQLGSGNSDKPDDISLWRTERFVEELECVRQALGLEKLHLLGHSWGTMLAASYLLERKPQSARSVIFSSPCLSSMRWKEDADRLINSLPSEIHDIIRISEAEGSTDSPEYSEAMLAYYQRFVYRKGSWPPVPGMPKSNRDVYMTMWGPSEFCPVGNLKHFDVTGRLHELELPSLFLCGRFDEATPEATQYYGSLVPGSAFHVFEHSAHLSYFEEPEAYRSAVRQFLKRQEG